ncbi:hypothetical protein EA796_20680, partial [Pseudomonas sp. AOB-7]|uniref:hypothetical protein n=1 Tax=Pseudomonas sp. AOB-7 TaxID=2482750 RepID=UPI000F2255A8
HLSVKLFFEDFFFLLNNLEQPQRHLFRFSEGAFYSTSSLRQVALKKFSFYLNNLALRRTWVRLSEARILHEHSEL